MWSFSESPSFERNQVAPRTPPSLPALMCVDYEFNRSLTLPAGHGMEWKMEYDGTEISV